MKSTIISSNGNSSGNIPTIKIAEDFILEIGDDFTCTGKELKVMMECLRDITKDTNPEEFI